MTATATKAMRADIVYKLNMVKITTISKLPERDNITYVTKKSKKNLQQLQWLVNDVLAYRNKTKKTVVYCRNIASCANLYEYFIQALGHTNTLWETFKYMTNTFKTKLKKVKLSFLNLNEFFSIVLNFCYRMDIFSGFIN